MRQVRRPRTAFTDRADPWSKGGGLHMKALLHLTMDPAHPALPAHRTFSTVGCVAPT